MNINKIDQLLPGEVIDNAKLCDLFGCGPQGGMRRSHATNTLIIVSNHVKSIYDDRWLGEVFHYTGMGTKGDQSLTFAQNKTLANADTLGVSVHLFEVFVEKQYTYAGQVVLRGEPYFEEQPDEGGNNRQACVFPLVLASGVPPTIANENLRNAQSVKERKARKLSDEELLKLAKNRRKLPGSRQAVVNQYERDPWVSEYAKREADGVCQLCEQPAPFANAKGLPYLETHHIVWLSKGGQDSVENTVALCPNCHRKMHVLDDKKDVAFLQAKKARINI